MKKSKIFLTLAVCLVAVAVLIIAGKNAAVEVSGAAPTPTPDEKWYANVKPMPEELKYLTLFEEIRQLKQTDEQSRGDTQPTSFKKSFYNSRLGLSDTQSESVDSIADSCYTQIRSIDQQAQQIIDQYRSAYPNGKLKRAQNNQSVNEISSTQGKTFEPLPPIPTQLTNLQNQKNQAILNAKAQIKTALGNTEFAKFDTAVQLNASRILKPLNTILTKPRIVPTPNP